MHHICYKSKQPHWRCTC